MKTAWGVFSKAEKLALSLTGGKTQQKIQYVVWLHILPNRGNQNANVNL